MTDYTLVRSRRRTAAIHIINGGVEVRAPLKMPKRAIDRFVASKEKWITGKLAQSRIYSEQRESFALNCGDTVKFRGAERLLISKPGYRAGFDGEHFYVPDCCPPDFIKPTVVQIYRRLAKNYLIERVKHYSEIMGAQPSAVKISGAKTRWGSCSTKKALNFSWRLIMADDATIDYVVVHELAHINMMNHSPRFWSVVSGILPDYGERIKRLKELQRRLRAENWE